MCQTPISVESFGFRQAPRGHGQRRAAFAERAAQFRLDGRLPAGVDGAAAPPRELHGQRQGHLAFLQFSMKFMAFSWCSMELIKI